MVIVGGSGEGKSVLLRHIAGLETRRRRLHPPERHRPAGVSAAAAGAEAVSVVDGVSEQRPAQLADRRRERQPATEGAPHALAPGDRTHRGHLPRASRSRRHREPAAERAQRRHAQARRHRARPGRRAAGDPVRRADGGPGSDPDGADRPAGAAHPADARRHAGGGGAQSRVGDGDRHAYRRAARRADRRLPARRRASAAAPIRSRRSFSAPRSLQRCSALKGSCHDQRTERSDCFSSSASRWWCWRSR